MKNVKRIISVMLLSIAFLGLFGTIGTNTSYAAEKLPKVLRGLKITPRLGHHINLNLGFQDSTGKHVTLKKYFDGKHPVLLIMAYYHCPMLCGIIMNSVAQSFQLENLDPGKDYQILTVSFDPHETVAMAAAKRKEIFSHIKDPVRLKQAEKGWHFLVGPAASSSALAKEIGFKYRYLPKTKMYAHGAAIFFLSGTGKLTRTLFGSTYAGRDLKLALLEAGQGKVGTLAEKICLFCYRYNPKGNKYSLMAMRLMTLGGEATLFVFAVAYLGAYLRKRKKKKRKTNT